MSDTDKRLLYTATRPCALRLDWRANGDLWLRIEGPGMDDAVAIIARADVADLITTLQAGP